MMMNTEIEEPTDTVDDDLGLLRELLGEEPIVEVERNPSRRVRRLAWQE